MNIVVFNGTVTEFDEMNWGNYRGWEQYANSHENRKDTHSDKLIVLDKQGRVLCVRWRMFSDTAGPSLE